jgi:hypothetical protein
MTNNNLDTVDRLIKLGMNEREAKLYLTLLNLKSATAADLHIPSGVPRTKAYEILKNMIQKGFCRARKSGNIRTFEVVSPKTALANSIRGLEQRLDDANRLTEELESLAALSGEVIEPMEYVETFYGKDNIHRHYMDLIRSSKAEIIGFGRPPYTFDNRERAQEQIRENYAFLARGGVARWVYEFNYPEQDWIIPGLLKGQEMGAQFHVVENLPMKMVIFDQKSVLFIQKSALNVPDEMTNALIKHSAIAEAFYVLFEFFWNHSMALEEWIKVHQYTPPSQ